MAHTLQEQSITLNKSTPCIDTLNDLFIQQFGYTQNGNHRFSPVDSNFGIRFSVDEDLSYTRIYVTFDGGNTEMQLGSIFAFGSAKWQPVKIYYQASKSEKVILLRIAYYGRDDYNPRLFSVLIAHDEKNKTVCFCSAEENSTVAGSDQRVYMIDSRKIKILIHNVYTGSGYPNEWDLITNNYAINSIYKYPSFYSSCMFSELYKICNLNGYTYTYLPQYINFNGEPYRIVSLSNAFTKDTDSTAGEYFYAPLFAFPVSD